MSLTVFGLIFNSRGVSERGCVVIKLQQTRRSHQRERGSLESEALDGRGAGTAITSRSPVLC